MGLGRKAYIVGINDYPNNQLEHCAYDASCMQELLMKHGNGDPNFHVLSETCATAPKVEKRYTSTFSL